jgi:hypothetical protein
MRGVDDPADHLLPVAFGPRVPAGVGGGERLPADQLQRGDERLGGGLFRGSSQKFLPLVPVAADRGVEPVPVVEDAGEVLAAVRGGAEPLAELADRGVAGGGD